MTTHVIAKDGTKLMPTTNVKKVRQLLRSGRAVICKYDPFTIQLQYESTKNIQDIEFKEDAGYIHIGASLTSQKHEYVSEQRDMLKDEVEHHEACSKYRRTRRNRKRYRAERRDNRRATKKPGWIAPSLDHKESLHIQVFERLYNVTPIKRLVVEIAQFDGQVLKAIEEGKPVPEGLDYQHGDRYGYDTLREAVFARDNYKCTCCGKSAINDNAILRVHHLGYWKKDRTNRMNNLATVCTKCHTQKNHKPGGKLYGLGPITKSFSAAAFMNIVKNQIVQDFKAKFPDVEVQVTFGAITKRTRNDRNIVKSHANDAYCMGEYHPKHRAKTQYYQKRRRNNRVLEKFYDAKFIDMRDGEVKSGAQLSCGRTNRSEPRNGPKNERIYRGVKKSKGRRTIRRQRYALRPGDIVLYDGKKCTVVGIQHYGEYVKLAECAKSVPTKKVKPIRHIGGWEQIIK